MNCAACEKAKHSADSPFYQASCRGCAVRGLAISIGFHQSEKAGTLDNSYRHGLMALFGDDWRRGHEDVKAEAARIKALRAQGALL
jgi:hypothetical protein